VSTTGQNKLDFKLSLVQKAQLVNDTLEGLLAEQKDIQPDLHDAIRYTLYAPGKRLRGALLLWCCEVVSGRTNTDAETAAAAIEMVHTYSLLHDDLPAMDNDDIRRGRASCHRAFNEATAILTGDALLALAFEVLAKKVSDSVTAVKLITELAEAAGAAGMIAGQMADLKAQNNIGTEKLVQYIHTNKTARMFQCACRMGAITGGADDKQIKRLSTYGFKVGLAFQVADDTLDISGTTEQLGKTPGKDVQQGKVTYPSVVGMKKAKQIARQLADEAVATLDIFGIEADLLRNVAAALLERTR